MKTLPLLFIPLLFLAFSCNNEPDTPEKVLEEYITSLANGNCERALELSVGEANDGAKYLLEDGCRGWKQEVLSVTCEESDFSATCQIRFKRDAFLSHPAGTYNYTYSLEKIEDAWKVSDQWKDFIISEEEMNLMDIDTSEN